MKIGLVQINNSFSGANYLPLAIGDLQAYAQKNLAHPENYEFLMMLYKRMPVEDAVAHVKDADIVGFSVYTWNKNISFAIAKKLKEVNPRVIIVCGGPQIPDVAEEFLREHTYIDIACHNEGEQAFVHILEKAPDGNLADIPSISYLTKDGEFHTNPWVKRMDENALMQAPSPYLEGIFDALMEANAGKEQWLALWETNRGCPFSCEFCDWGSATVSKVHKRDINAIYAELEWFARQKIEFIFCCDANYGIFQRDVEIAQKAADTKEQYGYPKALSVQNAKNAEERIFQAQFALHKAGLNKGVTLAFQSLNIKTLEAIKRRNISLEQFKNLQTRFTRAGIETYSDMIIALPMETYDSFADGISETIHNGQHNRIQFGNLSLMPNAGMGNPAYQKMFGLKNVSVRAVIYHGVMETTPDHIDEDEELVIETSTMSREEWVRTRTYCWMAALLHFDKLFQIPFIVLHETTKATYRQLIEVFTEGDLSAYPTIGEVRALFQEKARSIQRGDIEYCPAPEWLNMYWPPDEFVFIKLCREGKLGAFYSEAEEALRVFFTQNGIFVDYNLLRESIILNRELLKKPFQTTDADITLTYNVWDFCQAVRQAYEPELKCGNYQHHIDRNTQKWETWDDWCREVVWWGNKKGAYLYNTSTVTTPEMGGHY